MLRPVKHGFARPRLIPFKAETAAATASTSAPEFSSIVTGGTAVLDYTLATGFRRAPVVCANGDSSDVSNTESCSIETDPTVSTFSVDNSNSDAGTQHGVAFGWDSEDAGVSFGRQDHHTVYCPWDRGQVIPIRLNASGGIEQGSGFCTAVNASTGRYTVTLNRPFASDKTVILANPISASKIQCVVSATDASTIDIRTTASSPINSGSHILIFGSDNATLDAGVLRPLMAPIRGPRMVVGSIVYTAGVPAVGIGAGDFTVADTATGKATITLTKPFKEGCMVVCNANENDVHTNTSAVNDGETIIINAFNGAGSAVDPDDTIFFMALGTDAEDGFNYVS